MGTELDTGVVGAQDRECEKPLEDARAKGTDSPHGALRRAPSCQHFDFSSEACFGTSLSWSCKSVNLCDVKLLGLWECAVIATGNGYTPHLTQSSHLLDYGLSLCFVCTVSLPISGPAVFICLPVSLSY